MIPSSTEQVRSRVNFRTCSGFFAPLCHKFFHGHHWRQKGQSSQFYNLLR
ncbi:unnamed protein product [Gulo gulo]|uniref:Uncharacterized protein n=1 Tax=Gulo gulo TaxID=48420 RepID=A0A9X9M7H7_GULGU|nr:unnamed protein product [Gulo gulo]